MLRATGAAALMTSLMSTSILLLIFPLTLFVHFALPPRPAIIVVGASLRGTTTTVLSRCSRRDELRCGRYCTGLRRSIDREKSRLNTGWSDVSMI